jgi:hypothetical protein
MEGEEEEAIIFPKVVEQERQRERELEIKMGKSNGNKTGANVFVTN